MTWELSQILFWVSWAIAILCVIGWLYCTYQIKKIQDQRRRDDEMRDWLWRAK